MIIVKSPLSFVLRNIMMTLRRHHRGTHCTDGYVTIENVCGRLSLTTKFTLIWHPTTFHLQRARFTLLDKVSWAALIQYWGKEDCTALDHIVAHSFQENSRKLPWLCSVAACTRRCWTSWWVTSFLAIFTRAFLDSSGELVYTCWVIVIGRNFPLSSRAPFVTGAL